MWIIECAKTSRDGAIRQQKHWLRGTLAVSSERFFVQVMVVMVRRNWRWLPLLAGAAVSGGCTAIGGLSEANLVGSWYALSADRDGYEWQFVEYRSDGRKCGMAVSQRRGTGHAPLVYESQWWLGEGTIELRVLRGSGSGLQGGQRITDEVVAMAGGQLQTRMAAPIQGTQVETFYRVHAANAPQICEFAGRYARQRDLPLQAPAPVQGAVDSEAMPQTTMDSEAVQAVEAVEPEEAVVEAEAAVEEDSEAAEPAAATE